MSIFNCNTHNNKVMNAIRNNTNEITTCIVLGCTVLYTVGYFIRAIKK